MPAQHYTPVQSGVGNPKAHFGQEVFNPVLAELENTVYHQSGWYALTAWTAITGTPSQLDVTGIPSGWQHLKFVALVRSSQASTSEDFYLTFNSLAPGTYQRNRFRYVNSIISVTYGTTIARVVADNAPANHFSPVIIDISDYDRANFYTFMARTYAHATNTDAGMDYNLGWGKWSPDTPETITSMRFTFSGGNFATGCMYALYGQDW